jgi:hypothetical protein
MTGRQVLIGAGLAGAGILVAQYFYKQAQLLYNSGYFIRNLRVLKATAQEVVISFDFYLDNLSNITFRMTGVDIGVYSQSGDYLARFVKENVNILVPAEGRSEPVPMVIRFDPRKLGVSVLRLITDYTTSRTLPLRYIGTIGVSTGIVGFRKLGVDYTYDPLESED